MFHKARLKLTLWYLAIIITISLLFSAFIFRVADRELVRIHSRQQFFNERIRREFIRLPNGRTILIEPIGLEEIRRRILLLLAFLNLGIFSISFFLGYILAGKTLNPIKEMMEEQNRFISDASHEFRTPLTSLKSAIEVNLRDKKLTLPQAKTLLKESLTDVNKLQNLSDSLLALSQYQKPNGQNKFEMLSVKEIIKLAIKQIENKARLKKISIDDKAKGFEIYGNKYSLTDLLVILLDNAVKYSKDLGKITILTEKSDRILFIRISDEGIGISKKDLPYIFERFFRADQARGKSMADGYGLGLSIAKKITDLHGGTISVSSKINEGTRVSVGLPLKSRQDRGSA